MRQKLKKNASKEMLQLNMYLKPFKCKESSNYMLSEDLKLCGGQCRGYNNTIIEDG